VRRRSVADRTQELERQRSAALSAAQRVAEALALGERDLELAVSATRRDREQMRRDLERQRQQGRRLSRCMLEIIG
jgi:hypothetical protein